MKKLLHGWKVLRKRQSVVMQMEGCFYGKNRRTHRSNGEGPLAVFKYKKQAESFARVKSLVLLPRSEISPIS